MDDDPIAFVKARLDEDEAAAEAAGGSTPQGVWAQVDPERRPGRIDCDSGYVVTYDEGSPDEGQAPHIARHDPARMLREVEAKRAIVALHKPDGNPADEWYGSSVSCTECGGYTLIAGYGARGYSSPWPCPTLRHLAAVWVGHPDYRPEWKP